MAKQRHTEPPPSSSRNALVFMTAGGLTVAALVVWALMRTISAPAHSAMAPPVESPVESTTASVATAAGNMEIPAPQDSTAPPPPHVDGERKEVSRIAAEDLRDQFRAGTVTIIDVRDQASYESGHIPGALLMPFASIEGLADMIPKGKPIVTYCT